MLYNSADSLNTGHWREVDEKLCALETIQVCWLYQHLYLLIAIFYVLAFFSNPYDPLEGKKCPC